MQNGIFQKKKSIGSVEELQKNVKTMNPGSWILICAILAFLIGLIIFVCTTTYTSSIPVYSYSKDGIVHYYVKENKFPLMKLGQKVSYKDSDVEDYIAAGNTEPTNVEARLSTDELLSFGDYSDGEVIYEFTSGLSETTPGYHPAYIHIENYSLIKSFFD